MKKALLAVITAMSSVAFAWPQTNSTSTEKSKMEGTWELVSAGGVSGNLPESMKEIKLISSKHFVWVIYDIKKKKPLYTGGGTYIVMGDSCTERVDFMNVKGAEKLIGKDQQFTVKLDGSMLMLSGTLSDGEKLYETWKRVD